MEVQKDDIPTVIEDIGMVRILGLECPLDIFRRPNNFGEDEFNDAFHRATPDEDGTWLPDPLDLIVSKEATERDRDHMDIVFLEDKIRTNFSARLRTCSFAEAEELLGRYTDYVVVGAALQNPDSSVRAFALGLLQDLAAGGDPFAIDMIRSENAPLA